MKTSILNLMMAAVIGFSPLSVDAAPKKDAKKREDSSDQPRASAPKRAPQRTVNKAPSQPKRSVSKAPSRSPKVRSAPQRSVKRAPSVSSQRKVAAPKKRMERSVTQRPAARQAVKSQRPSPSPKVAQFRENKARSNAGELRRDRSESRSAAVRSARENEASVVNRDSTRENQRGNRVDRESKRSETADRDNLQSPRDRRIKPEERVIGGNDARRPRDLTADGRERLTRGKDRGSRKRFDVDRRPQDLNTPEARERREARAERRQKVIKERKQVVAQRQERDRARVERFRENRQNRVAAVRDRRNALRVARAEVRRENLVEARSEIRDYWRDRADDIRYRVEDRRDYLFDDDWWESCHWRDRPIYVSSPWWWWRGAEWSTVNVFLDTGWEEPILYDYGTDVIYDDAAVYVHGEPYGTPVEYSRRVIQLANPEVDVIAEAPVVEAEWTPLGVWALVQENQGDAVMFFQLSVDKKGMISGAYSNVVSGEKLPLVGQVDRKTQRAAWHIGDETEKVFEAGMANLAENQASCLVHIAPGEMQNWLLVRMESPELPDRPAPVTGSLDVETPATVNR